MKFISTRGNGEAISSSEAIIKGIADDGGLYVPIGFPKLYDSLKKKMGLSYEDLAYEIIGEFFDDIGDSIPIENRRKRADHTQGQQNSNRRL